MISAAVKGLARLVYEFSDLVSTAYNVLPSTFLLLQRKDKEVIKVCSTSFLMTLIFGFMELSIFYHLTFMMVYLLISKLGYLMQANLGLLKVLVAKSRAEGLQSHLKSMVEGLLRWQEDTKMHFKAKVCLITLHIKSTSLEFSLCPLMTGAAV